MSYFSRLPLHELSEMVAKYPDEIDLRLALVEHHVRNDQLEDALLQVSMAEDLVSQSPEVTAWKAMCLLFSGEVEQGHETLQQVVRNNPCCEFQKMVVTEVVPLFTGEYTDPTEVDWILDFTELEEESASSEFVQRINSFMQAVQYLQDAPEEGRQRLIEHTQQWPDDINAWLYLAIAGYSQGQIDEAVAAYRKVIELDPECATAWFDLAAIVEDPHEAIRLTERGLKVCPFAKHARYNLAMFMMQIGDFEQARAELSRIPSDHPIYTEALIASSLAYEDQNNFVKAAEMLEKVVILEPDRADVRGKYGQVLCDCGQLDQAVEQLNASIELDPEQYCVWANKGLAHLQLGQHDLALKSLEHSLELNPSSEDAAVNLAVLMAEIGNLDQAIQILAEAHQIHPDNPLICQNLGAFHCNRQEVQEALFYTQRAIELGIQSPAIYWNMANIYLHMGDRDQCLTFLSQAVEKDSGYAKQFLDDEDFKVYWDDPEFRALMG